MRAVQLKMMNPEQGTKFLSTVAQIDSLSEVFESEPDALVINAGAFKNNKEENTFCCVFLPTAELRQKNINTGKLAEKVSVAQLQTIKKLFNTQNTHHFLSLVECGKMPPFAEDTDPQTKRLVKEIEGSYISKLKALEKLYDEKKAENTKLKEKMATSGIQMSPKMAFKHAVREMKGQSYTDPKFAPKPQSLGTEFVSVLDNIEWKRARALYDYSQMKIFKGGLNPGDIHICPNVANDWLLCAFASLAERPSRIRSLFLAQSKNQPGVYAISMYFDGLPTEVWVDEYFPVDKTTGKMFFSFAGEGELWVSLLEKAYAKLRGNYGELAQGTCSDALADLTGAPCKTYRVDEEDEDWLWKEMRWCDAQDFVLIGDVRNIEGVDLFAEMGMQEGYSYGLIGCVQLSASNGGEKLVQLRDPWDTVRWAGDWSSKSKKWTKGVRDEIANGIMEVEVDEPESFWMNYATFEKYFESCSILYYMDGWDRTGLRCEFVTNKVVVSLTVDTETDGRITFNQKAEKPDPQPVRFCVLDAAGKKCLCGSDSDNKFKPLESQASDRVRFKEGKFVVVFERDPDEGQAKNKHPFVMGMFSDFPVKFELIEDGDKYQFMDIPAETERVV